MSEAAQKPSAWLVTGGRVFVDMVFLNEDDAKRRIAARKDGAVAVPLFQDAGENEPLRREAELLRAFAQKALAGWPECSVDGFELQDLAEEYGLIEKKNPPPTEPCGENCACVEYYGSGDWSNEDVSCYRRTPLLTGIDAARAAEQPQEQTR